MVVTQETLTFKLLNTWVKTNLHSNTKDSWCELVSTADGSIDLAGVSVAEWATDARRQSRREEFLDDRNEARSDIRRALQVCQR